MLGDALQTATHVNATTQQTPLARVCVCVCDPTGLVLLSIPGVPGAHQLTGVVLISVDRGQNLLTERATAQSTHVRLNKCSSMLFFYATVVLFATAHASGIEAPPPPLMPAGGFQSS